MNWQWITRDALMILHDESLAEHGGASGLRDDNMLESALARPQQLAHYGEPNAFELAASYAFGLAKNHPFADGNKRAAFLSCGLFLSINGIRLRANQADATLQVFALAAGELKESEFAAWLEVNSLSS
jgi:death on curing protein